MAHIKRYTCNCSNADCADHFYNNGHALRYCLEMTPNRDTMCDRCREYQLQVVTKVGTKPQAESKED